jgi:putative flippase GtrA
MPIPSRHPKSPRVFVGVWGDLARFVGVGVISYALGISLSALFHEVIGLQQRAAVGLSLGILLATNFWLARRFIFRSAGPAQRQILSYVLTSGMMRGFEYLSFLLLVSLGSHYLLALSVSMAVSSGLKFLLYRTVVFGNVTRR